MKNYWTLFIIVVFTAFANCSTDSDSPVKNDDIIDNELYFPPINSDIWETISIEDLDWNSNALQPLLDFLDEKRTKAFIILKNGKIAFEWYGNDTNVNTNLTWNSAAKTLTSFLTGIAQEEGFLNIHDASKEYLGNNWTSLTDEQVAEITVWNHLTMTTGLDYTVENANCFEPEDLVYKNEPGTFWYYHNAPYTITHTIISNATNTTFDSYFNTKLRNKIGINGFWVTIGCFDLYYSNARSMARFGLLNLNKGTWNTNIILNDKNYFNEMTTTSQNLNKSYGYFWWLNGKESYRLPSSEAEYTGKLIPSAPNDLFAALGKNDQKLYIVPSKNLVVVRMGENASDSLLGPSSFDSQLWEKINTLTN